MFKFEYVDTQMVDLESPFTRRSGERVLSFPKAEEVFSSLGHNAQKEVTFSCFVLFWFCFSSADSKTRLFKLVIFFFFFTTNFV